LLKRFAPETPLAVLSGILFALAFPPFATTVLPFICLTPLAFAVARAADGGSNGRAAIRAGIWFGSVAYGASLYWIAVALMIFTPLAALGYVASLVWLVPFVMAAVWTLFALRRGTGWPLAILLPIVWVSLELILTWLGPLSFPWLALGMPLGSAPVLAQSADLSGVRGVTFWVAAINGLFVDAWMGRKFIRSWTPRLLAIVGILAADTGYGYWRLATVQTRPLARIAVIQPNVAEEDKIGQNELQWDRQVVALKGFSSTLAQLSRQVIVSDSPQLLVWPETALPHFMAAVPEWRDTLRSVATLRGTPILTGIMDSRGKWGKADWEYFNAAIVTDSGGRFVPGSEYHKEYLVPVVERVPFLNPKWFASFAYFGGFGIGTDAKPSHLSFGDVGILICYESIFPELSRRYKRDGAEFLANITNDAWFGRSTAPYQHFAHLIIRAIETRLPVVRSANTGISAYIDPLGYVHGATDLFVPAAKTFEVRTSDSQTPFVRFGDWVAVLSLLTTLGAGAATWRRSRAQSVVSLPAPQ
jgi:apolipoprotein N-acyltransferase